MFHIQCPTAKYDKTGKSCLASYSLGSEPDKWLQDSYGRGLLNKKLSNNNIPSAPPFVGSETEVDQILTRKAHGTSCLANPSGSATTKESRSTTSSGIYNQSARFVYVCFLYLFVLFLLSFY
jgi:hypothetical protein